MTLEEILKEEADSGGNYGFNEWHGDIFDHFEARREGFPTPYIKTPDRFYLVQCISGDRVMGAGIAKEINERYHFRDRVVGEFARSFPGFGEDGWIFSKKTGQFIRTPLLKDENGGYSAGKTQMMQFHDNIGAVVRSEEIRDILGIVTKEKYYHKPTYESMQRGLDGLKTYLEGGLWTLDNEEKFTIELIMPCLGCGLDGLNWETVRGMIFETFKDLIAEGRVIISVIRKG